ncbi:response regulator [Variovorax guangxiensis]|uniref:Response regulator n=1 Tax=Variovorax guangxiensis TaxID=1775474 RepID=A0A433MTM9_9BURK|nr:response regulator [Variovorax guangxiensis]RUR71241.1 response regulator [Variovorax guangxiensis]
MITPHRADAIAIVDDDLRVRNLLAHYLSQEGYSVFEAENSASLSSILHRRPIDLIVLDLLLQGEDGFSICRRLRGTGVRTPIIILSARAEDSDRIAGLMMGADDYVRKPFNPRELRARIQAILRRSPPREVPGGPSIGNEVVRFGSFEFNIGTRTLRRDERVLSITTVQIAILKALVRHAGQALSRERLAQVAQGRELGVVDRSLDIQVCRLRKLLKDGASSYIQTVWGIGYMFEPSGRSDIIHRREWAGSY